MTEIYNRWPIELQRIVDHHVVMIERDNARARRKAHMEQMRYISVIRDLWCNVGDTSWPSEEAYDTEFDRFYKQVHESGLAVDTYARLHYNYEMGS
jgi:hypothetical protein